MAAKEQQEKSKDDSGCSLLKALDERKQGREGVLYMWQGYTGDINLTTYSAFSNKQIRRVALGGEHSIFLTSDMEVFSCGKNSYGQLGIGNLDIDEITEPQLVTSLVGKNVTEIACGKSHCGAVCRNGDVYCWGDSRQGQCGVGAVDTVVTPQIVNLSCGKEVCEHGIPLPKSPICMSRLACGLEHTLGLSCEGQVWVWGGGIQLGLGEITSALVPHKLEALSGKNVVDICCGDFHNLVLIEKSDKHGTEVKRVRHPATDVKTQKYFPSRCAKCDKEIYTYTDTNDTCIIENDHLCRDSMDESCHSIDSCVGGIPVPVASFTQDLEANLTATQDNAALDISAEESKPFEERTEDLVGGDTNPVAALNEDLATSVSAAGDVQSLDMSLQNNEMVEGKALDSLTKRQESCQILEIVQGSKQTVIETENREDTKVSEIATLPLHSEVCDKEPGNSEKESVAHLCSEEQNKADPDNFSELKKTKENSEYRQNNEVESSQTNQTQHQTLAQSNNQDTTTDKPDIKDDIVWQHFSVKETTTDMPSEGMEPSASAVGVPRSKSFVDENEAREFLARQLSEETAGHEAPTSRVRSAFQNILPYSSAMMQHVKSVTSKTISSISTSVVDRFPYSSGQSVELGNISESSSHDSIVHAVGSGSGSNSSLDTASPEPTQESSFIETSNQNRASNSLPGSSQSTPTKERSPEEISVSKKSQSLRTIWAKQDQLERRGSLPASFKGQDEVDSAPPEPLVAIDTEVWVWGRNNKSQLGLGDSVDRNKPSCVKMFSSRCVVKLAAGANHSLALTAVSQVYSWGHNGFGQLGHNENTPSPYRIRFMKGCHVWDIAAGNAHSLFLADTSGMKPDVVYSGKHPVKDVYTPIRKTSIPTSLALLKKAGWVRHVVAGGDNCACLLEDSTVGMSALYSFAASERLYYHHLNRTNTALLKPFLKSVFFTTLDVYPYKSALQALITAHANLTQNIGEHLAELTLIIRERRSIMEARQFSNYSQIVNIFRRYSRAFADVLAIGGFEYCAKLGSAFFEKIQNIFPELLNDSKIDKGNFAVNYRKALEFPLQRLKEYSHLTNKLTESLPEGSEVQRLMKKVVLNWESLKMTSANELSMADQTKAFWEGSNQKLADSLRTPSRRLLRDSKSHPLILPSAGRFSSHVFLLFNDVFIHAQYAVNQVYQLHTMWVETPVSDSDQQIGIVIMTPESTLELNAASPAEKAEWLMSLNSAINKVLASSKSFSSTRRGSVERLTPPLIRHAKHTFLSHGLYKDATYTGSWLNGKVHGHGELKWSDGRKYVGKFKHGFQHGHGIYTITRGANSVELHEGNWKDGKLTGLGCIRYPNGDSYEGYFKSGQRFGHGVFRQGRHMSSNANIYIGEWLADKRHGYGVQDDILRGEKYMGMWQDDFRHGNGIVVTLDGMYFEGHFVQNKLSGFGLMLTDDNSCYEGEFQGITQLQGKGILTLPTGDKLEGYFNGSWNEGLKINGTFIKCTGPPPVDRKSSHHLGIKSDIYGKLSVSADRKWDDIFRHCCSLLGYSGEGKPDPTKAWGVVAVMVSNGRKSVKELHKSSPAKSRLQASVLESLETIPPYNSGNLTVESYGQITDYLHKAFDTTYHPLGKLMEGLVDVFRAAYIGVGAHPRLLYHALEEVKSYVRRIYSVVRLLFPDLPSKGGPVQIFLESSLRDGLPRTTEEAQKFFQCPTPEMEEEETSEVVSAAGLLYPLLLPKIYPPLFDLYALYNDKEDEKYWERVMKLNRQGDMALMAYLGIEQKFWLLDEQLFHDKGQKLSSMKDECYASAVDMLQQISTAFSPIDKLLVLERTFHDITKTVQNTLGEDHLWCMDDLFPIFQYVVVRSKIRHLGAEIHMIDDLIENHLEYGELGLMSTTLKACYFQIQTEKMPPHH